MLKTRNISASGTLPSFWSQGKTGGTSHEPRRSRIAQAFGQDSRRVVDQAAAGDVRDPVDDPLDPVVAIDRLHGPDVDPGRLEELVGDRAAELGHERVGLEAGGVEGDLPRQAVAVGVQARAGQADHLVARPDLLAVEDRACARRRRRRSRPGRTRRRW